MLRRFVALLAAVIAVPAVAQSPSVNVTVSWVAPTTDASGNPLTGAMSYEVWLATVDLSSGVPEAPTVTVTSTSTTQSVSAAPGQKLYAVVEACDAGGCSAPSAEASVLVPTAPAPPSGVQAVVGANTTAYTEVKTADGFTLLPVGTVPAGTACDATQGVESGGVLYSLVPLASVTVTASISPILVLAQCGVAP